jgi:hypothetical protein
MTDGIASPSAVAVFRLTSAGHAYWALYEYVTLARK